MTARTLIAQSLRFHWRAHLGVLLGAMTGTAILVGALAVGDSLRSSLRDMALARLGKIELALNSQGRFFREELAAPIAADLKAPVAPAVLLRGTASIAENRAGRIQVVGVDGRFWSFSPSGAKPSLGEEAVVLNDRLAATLGAKVGDEVLLRVDKPSLLSRDAPLSTVEDATITVRVPVTAIIDDHGFGRFGLDANQIPPLTAFLPIRLLQKAISLEGRANVLLVGGNARSPEATTALWKRWQLDDAGLEVRELPAQKAVELRTNRVFLDPPVGHAANQASPDAEGVLTYFVNELRVGDRSTPYSTVSALETAVVPKAMADDEVLINQWVADDLKAKVGDRLSLNYWVVGPMRELVARSTAFRIRAVLPMDGPARDPDLMPDIPGLSDKKNCREWEPGVPIDLEKIRDKDQGYWDKYRGSPKAFITLKAGQRIWNNRFGDLTSVRYPAHGKPSAQVGAQIRQAINPASLGLFFMPVREQALAAGSQSLDFGQLFLSLSFFLIVAALILTGLMFALSVEQRSEEIGTLLALGWTPKRIKRLLLAEGALLAFGGGVLGAALGILYTNAAVRGLSTIWQDAIAGASIESHAEPVTLVVGGASGFLVAMLAIWLVIRKQVRAPARALLAGDVGSSIPVPTASLVTTVIALGSLVFAILLIVTGLSAGQDGATARFFGAGTLMLIAGLTGCRAAIGQLARRTGGTVSLGSLAVRNNGRRLGRSLSTVSLLALGAFLVVAIGVNRKDDAEGADLRSSGAGGFAIYADSTLPVYEDLNSAKGRETIGLEDGEMRDAQVVALRLREGDEASCLNMNRAQVPSLLGVRPEVFRDRFTFTQTVDSLKGSDPWSLLEESSEADTIPVIGDTNTIVWSLGKSVGGVIPYVDDRGKPLKLRIVGVIANSVLQGRLIASEANFVRHFPTQSGYRVFLIDAPTARVQAVRQTLTRTLENEGMTAVPAHERLAAFSAVENAYLSIFAMLGGLGLLLGSVGLGLVVLRNVLERRSELALMRAVGFPTAKLHALVLAEHVLLLSLGLAVGVVAALVAVVPSLRAPSVETPIVPVALTVLVVLVSGIAWTWGATALALRGPLMAALRNE